MPVELSFLSLSARLFELFVTGVYMLEQFSELVDAKAWSNLLSLLKIRQG